MKRFALIIAALVLFTGCRVTKPMLKMLLAGTNKVSTELTYADTCYSHIGHPYLKDGDDAHVLDIYYADREVRDNAVLIDFHGGFYVAGRRENSRKFASVFLKEGYDVVLVEYRLNDGKRDVSDELADCASALDYLVANAEELGLNKDRMFLTGDSAGGHLALYMAEASEDRSLPFGPKEFTSRGVLLSCPAYDFASFANSKSFTPGALEWFLGPRYEDKEWMKSLSPRTHLGSYTGPLFVSTCTRDFIRGQVLTIKADCDSLGRPVEFVDIESDDKNVSHVHNVINPDLPESRTVNSRMVEFMDTILGIE